MRRYLGACFTAVLVGTLLTTGPASAASCDTTVTSASELHASITNPSCEGMTIRIRPGTFAPEIESEAGDSRSATFAVTVDDLTLRGSGELETTLSGELGAAGDPADNAYHVVTVDTSAVQDLTIEQLTITGGHADVDPGGIIPCGARRGVGGGLKVCNPQPGSEVTLSRTTFRQNYSFLNGSGIYFASPGTAIQSVPPRLILEQSSFVDNIAGFEPTDASINGPGQGAGVYVLYADVDVSRSHFEDNRAGFAGAGMEILEGSADVRHSTFVNNTAIATSAAFRILTWDPGVQTDSNISNNHFENNRLIGSHAGGPLFQRAGAILLEGYANPDLTTTITHNTFKSNSSASLVGALEILNANAEIAHNRFEDNSARNGTGGALQITTVPLEFRGGIHAPQVTVGGNRFIGNYSSQTGGALTIAEAYAPPPPLQSSFVVTDNLFRGNHAAESGGAMSVAARQVTTSRNSFMYNRAEGISSITGEPTGNGGAIATPALSRDAGFFQFLAPILDQGQLDELITNLTIEDSRFIGNHALKDGGAISDDRAITTPIFFVPGLVEPSSPLALTGPSLAHIIVTGSTFVQNTAAEGVGGAIAMTATGQHQDYILTPFFPGTKPWVPDETSPIIPSTLELEDSRIVQNSAGDDGGGVFISPSTDIGDFSGNTIGPNDPNGCTGCS